MATLAVGQVIEAGGAQTQTNCAAGGDKAPTGDHVVAEFDNRHGSNNYTVTMNDPTSVSPGGAKQFDPDADLVVPFGTKRYMKLTSRWRNATNGLAEWTYSATPTTMTVAVYST